MSQPALETVLAAIASTEDPSSVVLQNWLCLREGDKELVTTLLGVRYRENLLKFVKQEVGIPSQDDQNKAALLTTADYQAAFTGGITNTPVLSTRIDVFINGVKVLVSFGARTGMCYFSGDSGTTARTRNSIVSGDRLYWVGSVAGYQLNTTDKIDINYNQQIP